MDNDVLVKDLMIVMLSSKDMSTDELERKLTAVLGDYVVTKLVTTIPSTGDGSTTKFFFEEFTKDKVAAGVKETSLKHYFDAIKHLWTFTQKELNLITKDDIIDYLNWFRFHNVRGGEKKPNTVKNEYNYLSTVFTWLFDNKYIAENPIKNVSSPKKEIPQKKVISTGEMEKITISCEQTQEGLKLARNLALLTFLHETGVRASECGNLKISDIDWKNRKVYIRNGKGNKSRTTYFTEKAEQRLLEYLSYRNYSTDDYLFTHYFSNEKLHVSGIERIINVVKVNSNISRLHPHLFRDTFATNLIRKGVSPSIVKELLGHSSLETLNYYVNLSDDDIANSLYVMN